jgi:hypothetical protein
MGFFGPSKDEQAGFGGDAWSAGLSAKDIGGGFGGDAWSAGLPATYTRGRLSMGHKMARRVPGAVLHGLLGLLMGGPAAGIAGFGMSLAGLTKLGIPRDIARAIISGKAPKDFGGLFPVMQYYTPGAFATRGAATGSQESGAMAGRAGGGVPSDTYTGGTGVPAQQVAPVHGGVPTNVRYSGPSGATITSGKSGTTVLQQAAESYVPQGPSEMTFVGPRQKRQSVGF